jgi:hypothetical protein
MNNTKTTKAELNESYQGCIAHLFQNNEGVEFTISQANEDQTNHQKGDVKGDIYIASWSLEGDDIQGHLTGMLSGLYNPKYFPKIERSDFENAEILKGLMDFRFNRWSLIVH